MKFEMQEIYKPYVPQLKQEQTRTNKNKQEQTRKAQ
jgi:hypothetical protein